jgi:CheY-like chemotaxis protein
MKSTEKNKILVVDDSTTNIVLIEAILSGKGYDIITSQSVKEASLLIKKQRPDLILLDLLMPKVSGYDFLKDLKANDETKDIPVIIVSAYADIENIRKTQDMGAIDFINKPIDIQNFVTRIEALL